tara:strand:+ start:105 stop:521 length:417 start_codon:yes stop_codon:yes gene_type:complete
MSFGEFKNNKYQTPMSEINVTPMVDVMLVLLVIFIITAPLFTHAIKLTLPTASSQPAPENIDTITLTINSNNEIFWNNEAINRDALKKLLEIESIKDPQPKLYLRVDEMTRYGIVAQILSSAKDSGLSKIAFVTKPKN